MPNDVSDEQPQTRTRMVRRAALLGALAAALCPVLFPAHHEMCRAIVNVCTGGIL